jgi:hypothetical protein
MDQPVKSNRPPLVRFALCLAAFWTPVLLLLGALELALWHCGETLPLNTVLEMQNRPPGDTIWLRQFFHQDFTRYKWLGFKRARPKVLVLGSSRVMRFRAEMFGAGGAHFYNMGGAIRSIEDLVAWKRSVPDDLLPEVLILGIDEWWFNENLNEGDQFTNGIESDELPWQGHLFAFRQFRRPSYMRLAAKFIVHGRRTHHLGFGATIRDEGFRRDGSYRYVEPPPAPGEMRAFLANQRDRVLNQSGEDRFGPAFGVSASRLAQLRGVLTELKEKHVLVLGLASAFSEDLAETIEKDPRRSGLWNDFQRKIPEAFLEAGFPVIETTRTSDMALDDRYMSDSIHAADTFHLYLLRRFLKDPRIREALPTCSEAIEAGIRSPSTTPWYPDLSAGRQLMQNPLPRQNNPQPR